MINLYTDGSCSGTPGPGGWRYVLEYGETRKVGRDGATHTTNNRMELMAVICGLHAIKDKSIPVTVHSDSEYIVKGMNEWRHDWKAKGWKNSRGQDVSNRDLWEHLDHQIKGFKSVTFLWVKAHNGHSWNEFADEIAREGTEIAKQLF